MAEPAPLSQSVVHAKCQVYLKLALDALGAPNDEIYRVNLATLVVQSMVGSWRFFHNFDHVVAVGGRKDPIEMLAGAFHDIVYVQVDTGIPFNLTPFLNLVVQEFDGVIMIRSNLPQTPEVQSVLRLFGFEPGQALSPAQGQNEFLSALVAMKVLEPLLSFTQRLAIAVCIEATIPFRTTDRTLEGGHGLPEVTLVRLQQMVQQVGLGIPTDDLVEMVQRSVRVANRDVSSFAQPSAADFLADTWNLLPENDHQFSPGGLYSVSDYRKAIERTEAFFQRVDFRSIFRQFRGEPCTEIYHQWQEQATRNLAVGRLYLSCKLVAIALIEALSEPFGERTSLETFMGALPSQNARVASRRLEQFLPPPQWLYAPLSDIQQEVWLLLSEGRAVSSHQADLTNAPLATFLLQCHGFEALPKQRRLTKEWLAGSLSRDEFLQQFNPDCLNLLYDAIISLWDRQKQIFEHHFCDQSETPVQSETGGFSRRSAMRSQ